MELDFCRELAVQHKILLQEVGLVELIFSSNPSRNPKWSFQADMIFFACFFFRVLGGSFNKNGW